MASRKEDLLRRIEGLYGELAETVKGVTPEQAGWQPGGEAWTILQILSHIGEFPAYFVGEACRIAREPGTRWGRTMADEARLRAVNEEKAVTLEQALQRVESTRKAALEMLRGLSDEDLAKQGEHVNPKFGVRDAGWAIEHFVVEHLEGHINQIRRNLRQMEEGGAASQG